MDWVSLMYDLALGWVQKPQPPFSWSVVTAHAEKCTLNPVAAQTAGTYSTPPSAEARAEENANGYCLRPWASAL